MPRVLPSEGAERQAIHLAHRLGSLVTLILALIAGLRVMGGPACLRTAGLTIVIVVALEFLVGLASVMSGLPIWLAVTHNWLASVLLIALVRLVALNRS